MAKLLLILLATSFLAGCTPSQESPLIRRTAIPEKSSPSEYLEEIDFYREALLKGMSPKKVYRPNLESLEETLDEKGITPEAFQQIEKSVAEGIRDRETLKTKYLAIPGPITKRGQLNQYGAILTELAKVRKQYDQVHTKLRKAEMELLVVEMEIRARPQDHAFRAAAANQETSTRAWMDKMIDEGLTPLHARIFELEGHLSSIKEKI
jgi:hypothetical protein